MKDTKAVMVARFTALHRHTVDPNWDGAPRVLQVNENVNMLQTTNGTMVLAYTNLSTQNNSGQISVTSGGGVPEFLNVPALQNQPSILVHNWKGDNLSITNISVNNATPIEIQAIGPGIPGTEPKALVVAPPTVTLSVAETAAGNASPQYMQLAFNALQTTVIALIGGPPDLNGNNGYVIGINYCYNSGPNFPNTPPPNGYYATTINNNYYFQFNWGSELLFIANMSSIEASPATIVLRKL